MKYREILKAWYEAQRFGVKTLRLDTTIQFYPESFVIEDRKGRRYYYKPKKTLRISGKYKLLSLVGLIRAYALRSASI